MQAIHRALLIVLASLLFAALAWPQAATAATTKGAKAYAATLGSMKGKRRTAVNVRVERLAAATAKKRQARIGSKANRLATARSERRLAARRTKGRVAIATTRPAKGAERRLAQFARRKLDTRGRKVIGAFVDGRGLLDRPSSALGPRNGGDTSTRLRVAASNGQDRRKKGFRTSQAAVLPRSGRRSFDFWCLQTTFTGEGFRSESGSTLEWMRLRRGRE